MVSKQKYWIQTQLNKWWFNNHVRFSMLDECDDICWHLPKKKKKKKKDEYETCGGGGFK
jgi:hypothetical protein